MLHNYMMFERDNLQFNSCSSTAATVNNNGHVTTGASNSRTNKSCRSLFNQPLRRFIIALVTLRLTSTSTSTATTVSSSAIGSLAALIKSLLIGCYYLLVFTSLLMLILYINHVASQNGAIRLDLIKITEPILKPTSLLHPEARLADQAIMVGGHASQLRSARLKRSADLSSRGNQTKFANLQSARGIKQSGQRSQQAATINKAFVGASKSANQRRLPVGQGTRTTSNKKLPELSERLANPSSRTSTGAPYHRVHQSGEESQWRPISLNRAESHRSSGLPSTHNPGHFKPLIDASSYRQASIRHPPNPDRFHQPRHWRRPRFNPAAVQESRPFTIQASKVYKRVLLCDKTLVSLDYIKNIDIDSRPYNIPSSTYGNHAESDDSVIDFDNDLESYFPERRILVNGTSSIELAVSATRRNDLVAYELGGVDERRSYLSDQDPLVRCDMWDLEKGIKNRKPPKEILSMAVKADFDTVRDAINRCRQLSERTLPSEDEFRDEFDVMSTEDLLSLFSMKRGLIPGTKWCGLGDQASSYNDLGPKHRIDICCRAHDHCPIRLKPFRNDYGVLNIALYTKSHCDCDADFYRCLREVHSRTADMLGNLYFNVMKLQCMREERMKVCREMKPIALGFERCVRYEDSPIKTVFRFTTPLVAY